MDFLNIFAIPHSSQVLKLMEILFFIGFSILVSYLGYLFGSLIYSTIYFFKATKKPEHFLISKEYLQQCCRGFLPQFGLGFIPLLGVFYCLVQFLQKAPKDFTIVFYSTVLIFIAFIVISKILLRIYDKLSKDNFRFSILTIVMNFLSILSIFLSAYFTIGIYTFSVNSGLQFSGIEPLGFLSFSVITRVLIFVAISIVLASLGYLFKTYSSDVITSKGGSLANDALASRLLSNTLIFGNLLPLFFFVNYLSTSKNLVTFQNFLLNILSLLTLLVSLILTYYSLKEKKATFARSSFVFSIISFALFFGSESTLLAVSNKVQEFRIARDYVVYHEKQLALAGRKTEVAVNGEEIYKSKCVACHQFDTKLVGPPHKEVLKKYENRKEDMVKFILNPVKVDPNYPPMPNQGIKPNEAKAVVDYMFEHYGPMLK